jgi:hypothetical protein
MKRVSLNYEWWDAVVEINYNENTLQWMKDQLLFWAGGTERIEDELGGDIEKAYLRSLAQEILPLSQSRSLSGIVAYFAEAEGWAALNDDFGVRLVSVDTWSFDAGDILLKSVQLPTKEIK